MSDNKKVKIIIISSVITVIIASVIIGFLFNLMGTDDDPYNDFDVHDLGLFVTDTDSLSIDSLSDDVIGTGVLYEDAEIYVQASSDSEVVTTLETGTTLLVYAAEGDYYKISNADNTVVGYVLKIKVNTGGIDLGNPDAETQVINEQTGKVISTNTNTTDVNPEDFPVNSSPYFIYVEKGSHTITIFAKDDNGKYTRAVCTYLTATGRTASLTPVGNFTIKGKEKWHNWGASYSPYCSKYYGGLFFHGPLYRQSNFGTLVESSVTAIGTNASSGCMRTSVNAAYFIYAFCPVGTNVKIVNGSPLGRGAGKPSISSQYIDPATNTVPVAGISFNSSYNNKTISIGGSFTATVDFTPSSATNKLCTWTSSNTKVATISSNQNSCTVRGVSAGSATITAVSADGSYKASFTVIVKNNNSSDDSTTSTTIPTEDDTTSSSSETAPTSSTEESTTSDASSAPETSTTSPSKVQDSSESEIQTIEET